MTEATKNILEEAGWYPGRKIDISYMIEDFKQREIPVPNDLIENLLKEYWNIKLTFKTPDGLYSDIRLNTEIAEYMDQSLLDSLENLLKEQIVPVGSINDETGILFVSYSGKFFMAANKNIYGIGIDFFTALDTIINQKDITVLKFK